MNNVAQTGPRSSSPDLEGTPRTRATVVYMRVSTEEQRERQTIENQRQFGERYAELHEIPIADWYADDGVTGMMPLAERGEGGRLLEDARRGKVGEVLLRKLDRLGRDPRLILNAVGELEALGVQVKSMTEPFDTSTPSGRFLLTILSGVAGLERETIIERSMEGTNRLAREGAWLGGIVPYGYHVEGKKRDARLVVSEEPLPGLGMSEADVIRLVYRLAVEERRPCTRIADHLNLLGVPPAYTKDGRTVLRAKRTEATSGIWRPSRVRNLLTNPTYMGVHRYGRRSRRQRDVIERAVPAVVTAETWEAAQRVLRGNQLFSARNAKRRYLLRGLMKCGLCGLTYIGMYSAAPKRPERFYYRCNGKHMGRGLYGLQGKRCPAKDLHGEIEDVVWADVEGFLREPGPIVEELADRLTEQDGRAEGLRADAAELGRVLAAKAGERDVVIGLFRRGRIDGEALDRQLDQIQREEREARGRLDELTARVEGAAAARAQLRTARDLLTELNARLDGPLTWERKRELVETLVGAVRVDTLESEGGRREAVPTVTYRFSSSANCTDTDSSPPRA